MSSDQQDPVIEKGDLFVCGEESLMVVSRNGGHVNLSGIRRLQDESLCIRERLRLQICVDPNTRQVFVRHYKLCYLHVKQGSPDYDNLKPKDEVLVPKPEIDARTHVKVGDLFKGFNNVPVLVTKVTKCFVTIHDKGRYKLSLGSWGPQLHFEYCLWTLVPRHLVHGKLSVGV